MPGHPEAIFHAALEISDPDDRHAFLAKACHGDPTLRKRVDALLAAAEGADDFFEAFGGAADLPIGRDSSIEEVTEQPGSVIGPFRLLEKLGEGGFGVVYRAQQLAPVQREVAIKIVKLGMDTREVVRRFEVERQALALMEHPSIAAVYDAGSTATGRPYFVMELVRGQPITGFCDARVFSVELRLELFIQVCKAVQHAHQKGVIHRDLKPSNILVNEVDGQPRPKVIDFGIVKATELRPAGGSLITRAHEIVGTPAYMSPEQASLGQMDIDTRSDIYSLGVLLYELLTGCPPFESKRLESSSLDVVLRIIREEDPRSPSSRLEHWPESELRAIAGLRNCHSNELVRCVRGELDWIVLKALEKDRARRYASATALGEDLERFLKDEPVLAAAPSATYHLRKLARRYRAYVAMAGAIAVILLVSSVVSTWMAYRAVLAERKSQREADNAKRQAAIAEATRKFLTDDLLSAADPMFVNRLDMQVREALDQAALRLDQQFRSEPLVEAEIRATLARIYANLGDNESALPHLVRAYTLRKQELGERDRETLRAKRGLAVAYFTLRTHHAAYLDRAEEMLREGLETSSQVLALDDEVAVDIAASLASAMFAREKYPEALALTERALHAWTNGHGLDNPRAAHLIANFAGDYATFPQAEKDPGKEEHLFGLALEVSRKTFGEKNPNNVLRLINLGSFYLNHDRPTNAETHFLEAAVLSQETLGTSHPWTWSAWRLLARTRLKQGNRTEAVALAHKEITARFQARPPSDPSNIDALTRIGDEFEKLGAETEAWQFYRQGLDRLGTNRPPSLQGRAYVVYWLVAVGDYSGAAEVVGSMVKNLPGGADSAGYGLASRQALLELMAGNRANYRQVCRVLLDQFAGTETPRIGAEVMRVCLVTPSELEDKQVSQLQQLIRQVERGLPSGSSSEAAWSHLALGMERFRAGDWGRAQDHFQSALEGTAPCKASSQLFLAMIRHRQGNAAGALQQLGDAERTLQSIQDSKFSWWEQHLFYLTVREEARRLISPE